MKLAYYQWLLLGVWHNMLIDQPVSGNFILNTFVNHTEVEKRPISVY